MPGTGWYDEVGQVVPSGAKWCQVVPSGAKWCQVVPSGAKWCQVVPSGAWWCELSQQREDRSFGVLWEETKQ